MRQEIKACHRYQCQTYITKYLPLHSFMTNITSEIPPLQTERTYFQVFLPKEAKDPSLPMFFCSKWSVGKVVDFAASQASLKNNNNVLTAKVSYTTQHKLCSIGQCLHSLSVHFACLLCLMHPFQVSNQVCLIKRHAICALFEGSRNVVGGHCFRIMTM